MKGFHQPTLLKGEPIIVNSNITETTTPDKAKVKLLDIFIGKSSFTTVIQIFMNAFKRSQFTLLSL